VLTWLCAGENGGERQRGAWDAAAPVLKGGRRWGGKERGAPIGVPCGGQRKEGGLARHRRREADTGPGTAGAGGALRAVPPCRSAGVKQGIQARLTRGSQSQCHAV
jgi:hypothetical protein